MGLLVAFGLSQCTERWIHPEGDVAAMRWVSSETRSPVWVAKKQQLLVGGPHRSVSGCLDESVGLCRGEKR